MVERKSRNPWRTGDKAWAAERTQAWRGVSRYLATVRPDGRRRYDAKTVAALKTYFLAGKKGKNADLLARLWFEPDPADRDLHELLAGATAQEFAECRQLMVRAPLGPLAERLARVFFPFDQPLAALEFTATDKKITLPAWPDRAVDNTQPTWRFSWWWQEVRRWLIHLPASSSLCAWHLRRLMWNSMPPTDQLVGEGSRVVQEVLAQCAHYISPTPLPGADTEQRRFVEHFRRELEARELPEYLRKLWSQVQSREGRSAEFRDSRTPEEDIYGSGIFGGSNGYLVFAAVEKQSGLPLLAELARLYAELGFSNQPFDPRKVEPVDLTAHLSPEFAEDLGYTRKERVPGHRYRVETNEEFLDAVGASVNLDLVAPIAKGKKVIEAGFSALLVVPRPAAPYYVELSIPYLLHQRRVRGLFEERTGASLEWFFDTADFRSATGNLVFADDDPWVAMGAFADAKCWPLSSVHRPLLDRPDVDFPPWNGAPLAPPKLDPSKLVKRGGAQAPAFWSGPANPDLPDGPPEWAKDLIVLRTFSPAERLLSAIRHSDDGALREAFKAGAALTDEAFTLAISYGKPEIVELLLQHGADASAGMVRASIGNKAAIIELLVRHGASPNAKDRFGYPLLGSVCYASQRPLADAVVALLAAGADPNGCGSNKRTPLALCMSNGQDQPIIETLLRNGADPNLADYCGMTPLMHLMSPSVGSGDSVLAAQLILKAGAEVNARDARGRTVFHYAFDGKTSGYPAMLRLLLSAGPRLDHADDDGITALHLAVQMMPPEIVMPLVEHGAPLEARDKNGDTPLLVAMKWARLSLVKQLVAAGADLRAKNNEGESAETLLAKVEDVPTAAAQDFRRFLKTTLARV